MLPRPELVDGDGLAPVAVDEFKTPNDLLDSDFLFLPNIPGSEKPRFFSALTGFFSMASAAFGETVIGVFAPAAVVLDLSPFFRKVGVGNLNAMDFSDPEYSWYAGLRLFCVVLLA